MTSKPLLFATLLTFLLVAFCCSPAVASGLSVPPEVPGILDKIYAFDLDGAVQDAKQFQSDHPKDPLGYLLEAESLWWRIWCHSADFKYGISDARHHAKAESDQHYLDLATKAASLAEAQIKQADSAEMQFYAGMADGAAARLYGLRGESRNAARAGVRGREHMLHAKALDASLADADFGLGLYNYYVDTLSGIARILRFFMGIPGGSKQDGIRQLERAISEGALTSADARFYLALNLHRYDQQYERALTIITPLTEKYPSHPIFQLARGDLLAKLGRKQQALVCYRAARASSAPSADCRARIENLVRTSIAALNLPSDPSNR